MAHEAVQSHHTAPARHKKIVITLPPQVVSPTDVSRLLREIKQIDESLLELSLRESGDSVKMPKTTRLMDFLTEHNKLNLLKAPDRTVLRQYLELSFSKAPELHFSFASDPSPAFLEKLITWLRREIHPHILVTVGLQPTIGAGCIVRSTNKYFDFSLGKSFSDKRDLLLNQLIPKA